MREKARECEFRVCHLTHVSPFLSANILRAKGQGGFPAPLIFNQCL
jgi:hypothetical protein